jgi:anti-sigma28 factor (negative regulator of flagellin synthesis)
MLEWDSMEADREQKVAEIKDKVRRGEYEVDPKAVADAMLRRLTEEKFRSSARTPIAAASGR